jgi:hypothetical protein
LIFLRDATVGAGLRGLRRFGSLFLRGFFSLGSGGGCWSCGTLAMQVWLVAPLVGAGCGVAGVNREAGSSKSRNPPTRIVEFGTSAARWNGLLGGVE